MWIRSSGDTAELGFGELQAAWPADAAPRKRSLRAQPRTDLVSQMRGTNTICRSPVAWQWVTTGIFGAMSLSRADMSQT